MANPILLRRRIKTAMNISKTTRAMQMIAASKLKKAQDAALSSRPYVEKLIGISQQITTKIDKENLHPYMKAIHTPKTSLFIVFSPDKGLCGSIITNLLKEILQQKEKNVLFVTVGRKIERAIPRMEKELIASFPFGNTLPSFEMVFPISKIIDEILIKKKADTVSVLSTSFTSIFSQEPYITPLIPLTLQTKRENSQMTNNVILFEPSLHDLLPTLLRHYIEMTLYQRLLESYLSEQAARMIAMQNATENAKDIISELKLEYNKARQEKITNEILDISAAAVFV